MAKEPGKMHDRSGWEQMAAGPRYIKGRNYKALVEFRRPCKTCSESFSIFVTDRIAAGFADTNSFALRNCENHRRQAASGVETAALRTQQTVMEDELQGMYGIERELRDRIKAMEADIAGLKNKPQKLPWEA